MQSDSPRSEFDWTTSPEVVALTEPKVEEFSWTCELPPRSKIQRNIDYVRRNGFRFDWSKFTSGILSNTYNKWTTKISSNRIDIRMRLQNRDKHYRYVVKPSVIQFFSQEKLKTCQTINFIKSRTTVQYYGKPLAVSWTSTWHNTQSLWDDTVDKIIITFRICREFYGSSIQKLILHEEEIQKKATLEEAKKMDFSENFMDSHLSDVTLECNGETFPGHRVLLYCASPVFKELLLKADMAKEAGGEGVVRVDDMEPQVLHQLLKFIYSSTVDLSAMSECRCKELYEAAETHNLEGLKLLVEVKLIQLVTLDNCVNLYESADELDAPRLKEKCWHMMRMNKKKIFFNKETGRQNFKDFVKKFPDPAHNLFILQG